MHNPKTYLPLLSTLTNDADVAAKFAAHLAELLEVIVPEAISPAYAEAVARGDASSAVATCAAYYRDKPACTVAELLADGDHNATVADNACRGIMREVNVDWTFESEIDYLFDPTAIHGPRNHEWLWQFNRHSYWPHMARAYRATGEARYAEAFRAQLLRWIAQTDIPQSWNGPGSAWRTIECGLRLLGSWPVAYDGFRDTLNDVTLLLMIASMHRQAKHLVAHPTGGNWLMMESNGVYTFSSLFPELSDAAQHRAVATQRLLRETEKQILPDGMHNELSPDYQGVVYNCAFNFYSLACALGYQDEIPPDFVALIHRTAHAAVLLSTPALTQPRTNDTYTIHTRLFTERSERLPGDHPVYRFVNSCRAEVQPPQGPTASAFLPYAGFVVMRSDWSADATYLCFDVGPLGAGHMHQDKLNINLYQGDEELIFDDGGGQYEQSAARHYGLSAYDHNTVLVDGMGQHRGAPLAVSQPIDAAWVSNDTFDYARASYDDTFKALHGTELEKPAVHTREVRFCKPDFYCVRDTLRTCDGAPHDYEVLFHLDTTHVRTLPAHPNAVISDYGRAYDVMLLPLDDPDAAVTLSTVSAQTEPVLRGWYNGRNERALHAATTVARKVCGVKDFCFTTLLFPIRVGEPLPTVTREGNLVRIVFRGCTHILRLDALNGTTTGGAAHD